MHKFEMRADIRERILARRGQLDTHGQLIAANTALTDADQNTSMNAIAQTFGDVMSTDEIIALLPSNT